MSSLLELSAQTYALLFMAALFSGIIDTIAGGGGLITLPAVLLSGVPPTIALATNKCQSCVGTCTATFRFYKKGLIPLPSLALAIGCIAVAAGLGTLLALQLGNKELQWIIPIVLIGIALYFVVSKQDNDDTTINKPPLVSKRLYQTSILPAVGMYDGFIGPGTGSFFAMAGKAFRQQTMLQATAHAKLFNFVSNFASLVVFMFFVPIYWQVAGIMFIGQFIGANIGAHITLRKNGAKYIRPLILLMCFLMLGRYMYQQFF